MTEDLEQKVVDSELLFAKLLDGAFDYLLTKLREGYRDMDVLHKKVILKQLSIVAGIEEVPPLKDKKDIDYTPYDPAIARNVREAHINRRELAKTLGFIMPDELHYAENVIQSYESGVRRPNPYSRSKVARKYFQWLKEHGYNPYNLR